MQESEACLQRYHIAHAIAAIQKSTCNVDKQHIRYHGIIQETAVRAPLADAAREMIKTLASKRVLDIASLQPPISGCL